MYARFNISMRFSFILAVSLHFVCECVYLSIVCACAGWAGLGGAGWKAAFGASPAAVYLSFAPKFVAATHKRKLITNSALKLATTATTTIKMNERHNE